MAKPNLNRIWPDSQEHDGERPDSPRPYCLLIPSFVGLIVLAYGIPIYLFLHGWGRYFILWFLCALWLQGIFKKENLTQWRKLRSRNKLGGWVLIFVLFYPQIIFYPVRLFFSFLLQTFPRPFFGLSRRIHGQPPTDRLNKTEARLYQQVALHAAFIHFVIFMVIYDWTVEYHPGTSSDFLHINEESPLMNLLLLTPTLWVPAVYGNGVFSPTMIWWGLSCGASFFIGLIVAGMLVPSLYWRWFGAQEE